MISLRRTLSVRFSITMFVALSVIAFWAFLGTQRILRQELDRDLAATARLQAAVLAAGLPFAPQIPFTERDDFIDSFNRFVVVRNPRGGVLVANTPLATDLPSDQTTFSHALAGEAGWTTLTWHSDAMRAYYLPLGPDSTRNPRVVQVAASLAPMRAVSRNVLFLLSGTVLLGMVATVFGAGWIARSAVTPVAEIAAQAESIGPGEVGQRMTVHAGVSEFAGLIAVLNQMLERLDRGVLAQRRIIADVSHDLRTPITAMRGEIEVALRHQRAPQQYRATLQSILEEVDHLSSINETLLTLARIEAGDLSPHRAPVDIEELLAGAVERVRPRAGRRSITIATALDGMRNATLDQHLLTVALDQLLDNAVRHTPDETAINLHAAVGDDGLAVVVDDDGDGVPQESLPHLFERFYRADAARGRTAGAGLGLTVVAAIIATHGGVIRADRSARGGLRIELRVPRSGGLD